MLLLRVSPQPLGKSCPFRILLDEPHSTVAYSFGQCRAVKLGGASGQHRKRSPIGRRHALAGLSGRAQPEVQQIDLRWRQQACQDLMRRAACDLLPVRWSGRTRRARRPPTTCTIRYTMPGGERQHRMRGIKDLIKLDGPALR
jgi:hypothetical protein